MIADIIDLIMFPVGQFLLMLKDSRIESYLGVSVLGIAVTCMIVLIVFRSLVYTVNPGEIAASGLNARDLRNSRERERQWRRDEYRRIKEMEMRDKNRS